MNDLSAVIYRSRAVAPMSDIDLFYLLAQARRRNEALGLSGLLIYDRGYFFQWIEGADVALGAVWTSIRRDPRHAEVAVFADQSIPLRLFVDWHMRFAHRDRQLESIVDGFAAIGPELLDELHHHPQRTPNILATFSSLGAHDLAVAMRSLGEPAGAGLTRGADGPPSVA